MKKILIASFFFLAGCQDYINREPLDTAAVSVYFNNEAEMNLALTGVYASSYYTEGSLPIQVRFDLYTDTGLERAPSFASGAFDAANGTVANYWRYMYTNVARANTLIEGMKRGKDKTPAAAYNRIEGEAKVLRAWAYYHLIALYGDVPYYTEPLTPDQFYTLDRTPRKAIADAIVADLEDAAGKLDLASRERGRVNRGVAQGLQARIHLLMGNYAAAAESAKKVIDANFYGLNPRFQDLFVKTTQATNANREIMFEMIYPDDAQFPQNYVALGQGSRSLAAQCGRFPIQALVDRFECTDGKRIDESPLYDPANPSKNRDLRLRWTVTMHGDTITGLAGGTRRRTVYNIFDASSQFFNFSTNVWSSATNQDVANVFGPVKNGMGYLWAKGSYDEAQDFFTAKTSFPYMRFAEILLMYAEAKIEANQVDATVISALNRVRNRSRMPNVDPAIAGDQAKLRQLVRRERAVELANEGFRMFDIRRWGIGKSAINQSFVYGAAKARTPVPEKPSFGAPGSVEDLNDIPNYSASDAVRLKREQRFYEDKHNLWPIPQREIDITNKRMGQNTGW